MTQRSFHFVIGPNDSITWPYPSVLSAYYCTYVKRQYDVTRMARDVALNRIREFEALPKNWDGYGAETIDQPIIDHARAILGSALPIPPYVNPHPAGTVEFEWETNLGKAQLELGVTDYSFYVKSVNGDTILDGGKISEVDGGKVSFFRSAIDSLTVQPSSSTTSSTGAQLVNSFIPINSY